MPAPLCQSNTGRLRLQAETKLALKKAWSRNYHLLLLLGICLLVLLLLNSVEHPSDVDRTLPGGWAIKRRPSYTRAQLSAALAKPTHRPAVAYMQIDFQGTDDPAIALFRVFGNDLPPRHTRGHAYESLKFILDHEPAFPGVMKCFMLNRIANLAEEARMLELLKASGAQCTLHIPFDSAEYATRAGVRFQGLRHGQAAALHNQSRWAAMQASEQFMYLADLLHEKNLYAFAVNEARNMMLERGLEIGARWVMPFDGPYYFTTEAWKSVMDTMHNAGRPPHAPKYFSVPVDRVVVNSALLEDSYEPSALSEPQLVFRQDAVERFNESLPYGGGDHVELLRRLKVVGPWDTEGELGLGRVQPSSDGAPWVPRAPPAGWVAHLSSGSMMMDFEGPEAITARIGNRSQAIVEYLWQVDAMVAARHFNFTTSKLLVYDERVLELEREAYLSGASAALTRLVERLLAEADAALARPPYREVDISSVNAADSRRVSRELVVTGHLFTDATILALAWHFTQQPKYIDRAAANIRIWAGISKGDVAPMWRGHPELQGLDHFLDAVRIACRQGALSMSEQQAFSRQLHAFSLWQRASKRASRAAFWPDLRGTVYDLQIGAASAFLDDAQPLAISTSLAQGRMLSQFAADGAPIGELMRTELHDSELHRVILSLQAWQSLALLAQHVGVDMWRFNSTEKPPSSQPLLKAVLMHNIPWLASNWSHPQAHGEDLCRFLPLFHRALLVYPELQTIASTPSAATPGHHYSAKPLFAIEAAVHPFWNLGLSARNASVPHTTWNEEWKQCAM